MTKHTLNRINYRSETTEHISETEDITIETMQYGTQR